MAVECHPDRCEHYQACLDHPGEQAHCESQLPWEEGAVEIVEGGRTVALFTHPRDFARNRTFSERRAFILDLLVERPSVTSPEIALAAHASESVARKWAARMVREGDLDVQRFGGHRPAIYTLREE